jgi:hypothetical protein
MQPFDRNSALFVGMLIGFSLALMVVTHYSSDDHILCKVELSQKSLGVVQQGSGNRRSKSIEHSLRVHIQRPTAALLMENSTLNKKEDEVLLTLLNQAAAYAPAGFHDTVVVAEVNNGFVQMAFNLWKQLQVRNMLILSAGSYSQCQDHRSKTTPAGEIL